MPSAQESVNGGTAPLPDNSISQRLFAVDQASSFKIFKSLCERTTIKSDHPLAHAVEKNIPIYDLSQYSTEDSSTTHALQDEWYQILHTGAGVVVLKNFFANDSTTLFSQVNSIFDEIIADEASNTRGDHFATSGENSRIWNSFQKHGERHQPSFYDYYSNPWLSLISESWLGPGYQVTAQVNIVRPGGSPQVCHRDYHLGFQSASSCSLYPRSIQTASQFLTLQGAVAHSQIPLESGPTRFLPYSQLFSQGYMAYRQPIFQEYFDQNWTTCAMEVGDAVFFNPALFHAAGRNTTTDIHRSANLLQISSAFGRPMETVDTGKLIDLCWDVLSSKYQTADSLTTTTKTLKVESFVKAIASAYPFPTNLDRRPPAPGGMAPESEADVIMTGLRQRWDRGQIRDALERYRSDSAA